jgi:hypothetical protein
MKWWIEIGLLVLLLYWFSRLAKAVKQRSLTNALLKLLRRIGTTMPGVLNLHQEQVAAAEQAVSAASLGPSVVITPSAWLRTNLEAARAVMLPIEPVIERLAASELASLTALLDAEQNLLARNKVAFSPNPGSFACRHISDGTTLRLTETQIKKLIPQIQFHTQGNRAYSRSWCRHCFRSFRGSMGDCRERRALAPTSALVISG